MPDQGGRKLCARTETGDPGDGEEDSETPRDEGVKRPTRKQFKFARDLATATGADIPNSVLHDRNQMTGFIAGLRAVKGK